MGAFLNFSLGETLTKNLQLLCFFNPGNRLDHKLAAGSWLTPYVSLK